MPDDTAALPEPFDINPGRHIPADPHQEDHEYTEREREAEIIVRVLGPLGPGGEGIRPDEGQQQRLAERDVEAGKREEDEAGCRHPMQQALERGKPHQYPSRSSRFDADHAADQVEDDEQRKHAEDGDGADPAQRHLMEVTPVAAGWLLDRAGLLVGDRATAGNAVELVEKLVLSHRARRRVDRAIGITLLRGHGSRDGDDERERHRTDDETEASTEFRHLCSSLDHYAIARDAWWNRLRSSSPVEALLYDAIVSRYAVFQPQAPDP